MIRIPELFGSPWTDDIIRILFHMRRHVCFYEMRFVELCKQLEKNKEVPEEPVAVPELSFENIKKHGMDPFVDGEVFDLCSKKILEDGYEEDEMLTESVTCCSQRIL